MKKILLFIFVLFNTFLLSQSKESIPGYVITRNNDTVRGNILIVDYIGSPSSVCCFDPNIKRKKTFYRADTTNGFVIGDRYFKSLNWQGTHYYFQEYVKGSPASLYIVQSRWNGIFVPVSVSYYVFYLKDDKSMTQLNRLGLKKFMKGYVKDCPDLVKKLDEGQVKFEDLKIIVEEYNVCK